MFLLKKKILIKINKKLNNKIKKKKYTDIFFFLGKKFFYKNGIKFLTLMNSIFGISLKRNILFFISKCGFSFNYYYINIPLVLIQQLHILLRDAFLNDILKKYIYKRILIQKNLLLYSGYRHMYYLPVRGQRSKTNAGVQKYKRKKIKNKNKK
jgi:ribosomal protein S13